MAKVSAPRFADHPAVAHQQAVIRNIEKNTGKTLEQWVTLVKKGAPAARKDRVAWLRSKHGLGGTTANVIALAAEGTKPEQYDPKALLDNLYVGAKAALRGINDELMRLAMALGKDVTATPSKTMVPLRRRHVFAQIKPSSNTRIDLGLALGGTKAVAPLIDTGGAATGDRITHRIPLTRSSDITADVKRWLTKAYELDE